MLKCFQVFGFNNIYGHFLAATFNFTTFHPGFKDYIIFFTACMVSIITLHIMEVGSLLPKTSSTFMFIITWKHCNYSIGLTEPKNVFTKPICWVAIIILSFILTDRLSGWPILFSNKHISSWLGLQASFLYCLMLLCSVTYLLPAAACIMFLPKLTFVLLYALFPSPLQRKWWFTVCSSWLQFELRGTLHAIVCLEC